MRSVVVVVVVSFASLCCTLGAPAARAANTSRVKDIVDVSGIRDNALFGYGLVVGLGGTGDTERVLFTQQSMSGMLGRLGVRVDPNDIRSRNVAAVLVTAQLSTFARPGAKLDVSVSSLGDARSLVGGTLVLTPLTGPDGKVYAVAQGAVQTGGFTAESAGSRVQKNQTTAGRVPSGAVVEDAVLVDLRAQPLLLTLKRPDVTTAKRIADAVNKALGAGKATVLDPAAVQVALPDAGAPEAGADPKADPKGAKTALTLFDMMAKIEALEVDVDGRARIVISERTGTVVAGEGVRIRPVAVAHGSLQISIGKDPLVSQPAPFGGRGDTAVVDRSKVDAAESGSVHALPATTTVDELVAALSSLGATPRDLVAILQAIVAAGALDADIEVM